VKAAHYAFKFAFNREGIGGFNRAVSGFGIVAQQGRNILFVVQTVLQFLIAMTHVVGNVGVVVVFTGLIECPHPHARDNGQFAPFHSCQRVNAVP